MPRVPNPASKRGASTDSTYTAYPTSPPKSSPLVVAETPMGSKGIRVPDHLAESPAYDADLGSGLVGDAYRHEVEQLFRKLADYELILCVQCGICVWPTAVRRHLKSEPHYINNAVASAVQKRVQSRWPALWLESKAPSPPEALDSAIEGLPIFYNGLACEVAGCSYICNQPGSIVKHFHLKHAYIRDDTAVLKRGKTVACTRFFTGNRHGEWARFVAVRQRPAARETGPTGDPTQAVRWRLWDQATRRLQQATAEQNDIISGSITDQPNMLADQSRMSRLFKGRNRSAIMALGSPPAPAERFGIVFTAMSTVILKLHIAAKGYSGDCRSLDYALLGHDVLRTHRGRPVRFVQDKTVKRYARQCARAFVAALRLVEEARGRVDGSASPCQRPYSLTVEPELDDEADEAVDRLFALVEIEGGPLVVTAAQATPGADGSFGHDVLSSFESDSDLASEAESDAPTDMDDDLPSAPIADRDGRAAKRRKRRHDEMTGLSAVTREFAVQMTPLEDCCCEAFSTLLRRRPLRTELDNPLTAALCVLGVYDGGYLPSRRYTSILAAFIYVGRLILFDFAARSRRDLKTERPSLLVRLADVIDEHGVGETMKPLGWAATVKALGESISVNIGNEGFVHYDNGTVSLHGASVSVRDFGDFVGKLCRQLEDTLRQRLLLRPDGGSATSPYFELTGIIDDAQTDTVGNTIAHQVHKLYIARQALAGIRPDEPRDIGGPIPPDDVIMHHISQDPALNSQFFDPDGRLMISRAKTYLSAVDAFLEDLLLLMHFTGGQPARGPEILSLRHQSTQHGGARGLIVYGGRVISVTNYNKSLGINRTVKPIVRAFPDAVGQLILGFLTYVHPFRQRILFYEGMDIEHDEPSPYLWPSGEGSAGVWSPSRMTAALQRFFAANFNAPMVGVKLYRHIAIAFCRHEITGPAAAVLDGVASSLSSASSKRAALFDGFAPKTAGSVKAWTFGETNDMQAGHSSLIANQHYAVMRGTLVGEGGMPSRDAFCEASFAWHRLLGFEDRVGLGPRTSVGRDHWREQRSLRVRYLRASTDRLQFELEEMYGRGAKFRGRQSDAVRAILAGYHHVTVVMPTGVGKTLLIMLPAKIVGEGTTIVVVPTLALRDDIVRRCGAAGLPAASWSGAVIMLGYSVVVVTMSAFPSRAFQNYCTDLLSRHRLDRVFFDECHTLLDEWRQVDVSSSDALSRIPQIICMSATLPPYLEESVWMKLNVSRLSSETIRQSTSRNNLEYIVTRPMQGLPRSALVDLAIAKVKSFLATDFASRRRVIVYCRLVSVADTFAKAFGCDAYHAKLADDEKERMLRAFSSSPGHVIAATSALGLGVDIGNVGYVLGLGLPATLADYAQESGRAGRDGRAACTAELIVHSTVQPSRKDSNPIPLLGMELYLDPVKPHTMCRRSVLDTLDFPVMHGVSCKDRGSSTVLCDLCRSDETGASSVDIAPTDEGNRERTPSRSATRDVLSATEPYDMFAGIPAAPVRLDDLFVPSSADFSATEGSVGVEDTAWLRDFPVHLSSCSLPDTLPPVTTAKQVQADGDSSAGFDGDVSTLPSGRRDTTTVAVAVESRAVTAPLPAWRDTGIVPDTSSIDTQRSFVQPYAVSGGFMRPLAPTTPRHTPIVSAPSQPRAFRLPATTFRPPTSKPATPTTNPRQAVTGSFNHPQEVDSSPSSSCLNVIRHEGFQRASLLFNTESRQRLLNLYDRIPTAIAALRRRCTFCMSRDHTIGSCQDPQSIPIVQMAKERKRNPDFARYTCCFSCGAPQSQCPNYGPVTSRNTRRQITNRCPDDHLLSDYLALITRPSMVAALHRGMIQLAGWEDSSLIETQLKAMIEVRWAGEQIAWFVVYLVILVDELDRSEA